MSINQGNKISTKGLVFAFDAGVDKRIANKSFRGRPTTNWLWNYHARIDSSYSSYTNTSSGTWPAKHNDAITVYSVGGNNLSNYVNSGVTDYTNTYHAHWVLDPELGRPVVIMRNFDGGQWKAKWMNTGKTKAQMGLAVGDKYTISYLQWTDNIARGCNVGLYSNNGTSNNFWDGTTIIKNTKVATWQRVSHTYTVSNNGTGYTGSVYMYGHYGGRGVLKIADVQIEKGGPSPFIAGTSEATSTRSNTQALLDWTGTHTITANSLTYNDDGGVEFDSTSNDKITVTTSSAISPTLKYAAEAWVWADSSQNNTYPRIWDKGNILVHITQTSPFTVAQNTTNTDSVLKQVSQGSAFTHSTWTHIHTSYDGRYGRIYINGSLVKTTDFGAVYNIKDSSGANLIVGGNTGTGREFNGKIASLKFYDRVLNAEEVLNNYNAHKDRFV